MDMQAQVKITASIDELKTGLNEATSSVKSTVESINSSVSSMTHSMDGVVGSINESTKSINNLIDSMKSKTNEGSQSFNSLGTAIKTSLVYGGVYEAISAITDSIKYLTIGAIGAAASFEQMRIGIAAIIAASSENTTSTGEAITTAQKFAMAQSEASRAVELLKKANLETIATLPEITEAFQNALAPARSFGLSMEQTVTFTKDMANAAAAIGVPMNQLSQELRAVFEGDTSRNSRVNQILQIKEEMIKTHAAAGDLFEFLQEKLIDFAAAGEANAQSWNGIVSNIQDGLNDIRATAAQDIFADLKESGLELQKSLKENSKEISNGLAIAFKQIWVVGESVFINLRDLASVVFGSINDLVKLMNQIFGQSIDGMNDKYRELGFFDYMVLGITTSIEGLRQLADVGLIVITGLGRVFNKFGEGVNNAFSSLFSLIASAAKAVGLDSIASSFVSVSNDMMSAAVSMHNQDVTFIEANNKLLNDMKGGVDRLTKSYNDLLLKKQEASKQTTGANSPSGDLVSKPAEPHGKTKDESGEFMRKSQIALQEYQNQMEKDLGHFHDMTKAEELRFWEGRLSLALDGGDKYKKAQEQIEAKVAELRRTAPREAVAQMVDELRNRADLNKQNLTMQVNLYSQIADIQKAAYGEDSKEYRKALIDKQKALDAFLKEEIKQQADAIRLEANQKESALKMEQADLESYARMGIVSEQEKLERLRDIENRRYEIKSQALAKELALYDKEPQKQRQVNDQIDALNNTHNEKLKAISNQLREVMYAPFKGMIDSLQGQFSSALAAMMKGTLSFSSFIKGIIPAIAGAFADMAAQMAAKWLFEHTIMKGISALFGAEEMATTAAVTAEQIAASKLAAAGQIPALTEIGAMGAYSALAPIPVVGPALAMAAYEATQALGASSLAIASASGGFDIGAGINPMTQLHEQEMVLPAHIANPLRDSLKNGGVGGGGTNITIHAIDAKGVKDLFMQHGSALVDSLKKQNRNFAPAR